ncbi:MAG: GTP-binding protein [Clostridiales bacterium]|nr:GTP-binding protein [Clostridiales bacterium]
MSINGDINNNTSNNNDIEVAKLRRVLTILLSVSAILAVVLVTVGISRIVRYMQTSETSGSTPVIATIVSTEMTFTEPVVYHTEQLEASDLVENYFRPLPELPEEDVKTPEHVEVKALYIGSCSAIDKAVELCNNSELNAVVIDLKNEYGLPYMSHVETAREIGYVWDAYDLDGIIKKCHDNNIRVIGRIVSFNDQLAAKHFPERAIQDANGNVVKFSNEGNNPFLSPYNSVNWDYLIAIGIEACEHGIDEIQFDYVRFPAGATQNKAKPYFGEEGQYPSKAEAVNRFLQEARIRIQDTYGIPVSADIFGIVLTSEGDAKIIGQDFATLGMTGIDSCCPMVYPSHYALGTMVGGHTFKYPDKEPYLIVYSVLHACQTTYKQPGFTSVRPYLQAFTASYIGKGNYMEYGYREINSQIKAIKDLGITEFILWDPSCKYPAGSYDGDMSVETD